MYGNSADIEFAAQPEKSFWEFLKILLQFSCPGDYIQHSQGISEGVYDIPGGEEIKATERPVFQARCDFPI